MVGLLTALRAVAERHVAEVDRLVETYLRVRNRLEPVPREELLDRARRGLVIVLDVRPPEEYAAGYLPGARNVPLEALEAHLARLDPDQEVVAYCRGPHCVLAYEAVACRTASPNGVPQACSWNEDRSVPFGIGWISYFILGWMVTLKWKSAQSAVNAGQSR